MKKKLSEKTEAVVPSKAAPETKPDIVRDTLYHMNIMECPFCRTRIKGFVLNERDQCLDCGQGYIVLKGTKVVFALT